MWHAMPNMESLLNYNPVNLLWTFQRTMSPLKTFFRSKNRNKPTIVDATCSNKSKVEK